MAFIGCKTLWIVISIPVFWFICLRSLLVHFKMVLGILQERQSGDYPFDDIPAAKHVFEKLSPSSKILIFICSFISICFIVSASSITKYL